MDDGKSGPKKLSPELKLLPGVHNPRNTRGPRLPASDLKPPQHLDRAAKREWRRVTSHLRGLGVLSELDLPLLEIWCTTWAQLKRCESVLAKEGDTFSTPTGYVQQRPEVAIRAACIRTLTKLSTQLGFSPAARSRLELPIPAPIPAQPETRTKTDAEIEKRFFGPRT